MQHDISDVIEATAKVCRSPLAMQREATPLDDYTGHAAMLYGAFWSLFVLRRGLPVGRALNAKDVRRLMLYHDNRFSQHLPLLYQLADTLLRHSVNSAVVARVRSHPDAFAKFEEVVNDPDFEGKLAEAVRDPKGAVCREVMQAVMPFVTLSASKVPWGTEERRSEFGKLLGKLQFLGAGNNWLSMALDDVHSPSAIRWAQPYAGPAQSPALPAAADLMTALRGQDPEERRDGDGVACSEAALQQTAAENPVACTVMFNRTLQQILTILLGLPPTTSKVSGPFCPVAHLTCSPI